MAFFATARRQTFVSLPYDVPDLPTGHFALYAPARRAYAPAQRPRRKLFGLLAGARDDAEYYARQDGAAWLADMARGICCPRGAGGFLWAHNSVWDEWRRVGVTEPLRDTSYLYQPPPRTRLGLQTMYQRTVTASSYKCCGAERLVRRLIARDGYCWISRAMHPLRATRILPKNMPLVDKQRALDDFALPGDAPAAPLTSAKDIRLTLFLTHGLEHFFERFWLGFRWTGTDAYECHSFVDGSGYALTTFGLPVELPFDSSQLVHGTPVAPPYPQADDVPPAALLRWHYLQCVLKKFRHADYLGVPDIRVPAAYDYYDNRDFGREREADFDWDTHLRSMLADKSRSVD